MIIYVLFIIGFVVLIKGADLLVDGAAAIAKRLNVSNIVIGLTIVAFGTSVPELMVNVSARVRGNPEITIGDILGSNIANILLILGISAIVYPITVNKNTTWKEIPFTLLAALLLGVMVNGPYIDGSNFAGLTRSSGVIFISFFIIFLYYIFGITRSTKDLLVTTEIKELGILKSIIFIVSGLIGLVVGGKWIVDGAVKIAENFSVSQSLIGLTIVAIGTSLPELATCIVAAYKKQTDIAIGNIIGSNIFNIFWVLGISAIVHPLPFKTSSNVDVLMTIFASLILLLVLFVGKKRTIERWQGFVMVAIYIGYITFLVIRG
jgi:cation:H+ antiporter